MAYLKEIGTELTATTVSRVEPDTRVVSLGITTPYLLKRIPLSASGGAFATSSGKEVLTKENGLAAYKYLAVTTSDQTVHNLPIGPLTKINIDVSGGLLWEAMFRPDEAFSADEIIKIEGS